MRSRDSISTKELTRYEVALMRGDDILHIYGYTPRKSKHGILALVKDDVTHLLTATELTEDRALTYSREHGFTVATNVYIRFTGRTERQVAV